MPVVTKPKAPKAVQMFHAECRTCSYVGRQFENKADAENDGDEHEIAVGDNKLHHYTRVVPEVD